jgi:hypothetical protein
VKVFSAEKCPPPCVVFAVTIPVRTPDCWYWNGTSHPPPVLTQSSVALIVAVVDVCRVPEPDAEQAVIMTTHVTTQDARVSDGTLLFMT